MTVRKAASAGLWSALDIGLRQGVGFLVSIILARLLMPEDFGIVALLTFFSSLSMVFVQGGLTTAVIQQQETSRDEESAIFWFNLAASLVFAALLLLAAGPIARFFDRPVLALLMPFASAQVFFSALAGVQTALLTRSLRFRPLTVAGVAASIVSGLAGVAAALAGWGVYALALQMVTLAAVNAAVIWWVSDWRPNRHFRFATIRKPFRFGVYLSLSSLLDVLSAQGFALVLGKLHGMRELGLVNRANGTQQFVGGILTTIITRIALPLFASKSDDPEALRRGVRMAVRTTMLLNVPAMTGLAALADLIILVLFGAKWLPAGPILAILAIGHLLVPLHVINLQLLLAQGRSDRFFRIEVAKKVPSIVLVVGGSYFGIYGVAWAVVIMSVISLVMNAHYTRITASYGVFAQLGDSLGAVALSLIMASMVLTVRPLLPVEPPLQLAILAALGAATYGGMAFLLVKYRWTDIYTPLASLIRKPAEIGS